MEEVGGRRHWLDVAERGTVTGIWALVVLSTLAGRRPTRAFLHLVVSYYLATSATARRASREYLERIHGPPVGMAMVYQHLLRFAQCTLDRLFFVQGKTELFEVSREGEHYLRDLLASGQGAILLGSHLGSFEALQRMAVARQIPINIVGYFRNARMINAVLKKLNPQCNARLIELDPSNVEFVFEIRELIEAGQLVAILNDRVIDEARSVEVDFLGGRARFPTGALILASVLRCPVFLIFGLHRGGQRHYELIGEPFAEEIVLPRRDREQALVDLTQRYADRLAHYCRLAPDNWFNFYDFWSQDGIGPTGPGSLTRRIFEGSGR